MQKYWKCKNFDAMIICLHHTLCTYFLADVTFLEELVTHYPLSYISHLSSLEGALNWIPLSFRSHFNLFPSSSRTYVFILAEQQVLECLFERGVAQCVTSGVNGRVDITQPISDCPHSVWHAGLAEGWDQHHDVIRCPRNDESQQDGKDSLGHL